jgi:hypothetical protein
MQVKYIGVRGWLLFFYILAALNFLGSLYDLIYPDPDQLAALGGNAGMLLAINLFFIALQLPFLALTPLWHPLMPSLTIACTWIHTVALVALIAGLGEASVYMYAGERSPEAAAAVITIALVVTIVISALWTWYLLCSKRVNVTFRNRVHDWEEVVRSRGRQPRAALR